MKTLSYNIRGLGDGAKRRVVRELVCRNHVEVLCIQETKVQSVDRRVCGMLWGDSEFDWKVIPAVNRGGGLLCVWNSKLFVLEECVEGIGFLGLIGRWEPNQRRCVIVNVYSACDLEGKRSMWNALCLWRSNCDIMEWCLAGDFNAVRYEDERKGTSGVLSSQRREMHEFNLFIANMELVDIPLAGRRFTWRRPNNQAQSRIDRFLVSGDWCEAWPNCSQLVLNRDISDHCPLLLRQLIHDWGPKPFRVLNCWLDDPRLVPLVEQSWRTLRVQGWGAYVLKEKLKGLRGCLKEWNTGVFGDLKSRREEVVKRINLLDVKEEEEGLSREEVASRRDLLSEFWKVLRFHESLLCQKARVKWLAEGDQNTRFFHSTINWRRRVNSIVGLLVDGVWEEEPGRVKAAVHGFFEAKFKSDVIVRPKLDGVQFTSITEGDNSALTEPFEEDEIRRAVWECGGSKSPGPDGYNFRFIQKFTI